MPDENDVTQADSSPAEGALQHPDTGAVTPETVRTLDNVHGEFTRKFGKLDQKIEQVLQYLASQAPVRPAVPTPSQGQQTQPTDQELYALAQQGDQTAYQEYLRRQSERVVDEKLNAERRNQFTLQRLQNLVQQYPDLQDGSHPLTRYAHQVNAMFIQQGWRPDMDTLLAAAHEAVSTRRDLISTQGQAPMQGQAPRPTLQQRQQAGTMGGQHRATQPAANQSIKISPEQAALAKRMNIKDPVKAIQGFKKRQESGESRLGGVSAFIREEEL